MPTRSGPFYIMKLARALARLPRRAEWDTDEAYRIADDIAESYFCGEFGDDEVVAYAGDPPSLRTLAEIEEVARSRGDNWQLSHWELAVACFLTAPATRRYLESCGFAGALRVLRESFGAAEAAIPEATKLEASAPRELEELQRDDNLSAPPRHDQTRSS